MSGLERLDRKYVDDEHKAAAASDAMSKMGLGGALSKEDMERLGRETMERMDEEGGATQGSLSKSMLSAMKEALESGEYSGDQEKALRATISKMEEEIEKSEDDAEMGVRSKWATSMVRSAKNDIVAGKLREGDKGALWKRYAKEARNGKNAYYSAMVGNGAVGATSNYGAAQAGGQMDALDVTDETADAISRMDAEQADKTQNKVRKLLDSGSLAKEEMEGVVDQAQQIKNALGGAMSADDLAKVASGDVAATKNFNDRIKDLDIDNAEAVKTLKIVQRMEGGLGNVANPQSGGFRDENGNIKGAENWEKAIKEENRSGSKDYEMLQGLKNLINKFSSTIGNGAVKVEVIP
jgi:hypothetical protein